MTPGPSRTRVVVNVLSTWGGQAIALGLGFVFAPFVVRSLGDAAYGIWTLALAAAGFMSLLDLGVRGAVTRYVARSAAAGDDDEASRIASSSLQIFLAIGGLVAVVATVLAAVAPSVFDIPPAFQGSAQTVFLLAGVNVALSLIAGTYAGAVAAKHRVDLLNLVDVTSGVLRTLAAVAILSAGAGLVGMAVLQVVLSVARLAVVAGVLREVYPALRIRPGSGRLSHVRLILSFSVWTFLIHVSGRLIYYSDALVIGAFLPVGLLTSFAIGATLVEYARTLVSAVSYTTSPMASSYDGTGDRERIRQLLLESARFSMLVLMPVAITFLIRGRSFIELWMGPEYAAASGGVLAILAWPLLLHAATHATGGLMMATGRHMPMIPAMLIEAGANLALSIALVRTMGIAGVAWGTAIPSLVSSLVFWPIYLQRSLELPARQYFFVTWARPAAAMLPFLAATSAVELFWPASSLGLFAVQVALCTTLVVAGGWWICFSRAQRDGLREALRRRLRRGEPPPASPVGASILNG